MISLRMHRRGLAIERPAEKCRIPHAFKVVRIDPCPAWVVWSTVTRVVRVTPLNVVGVCPRRGHGKVSGVPAIFRRYMGGPWR